MPGKNSPRKDSPAPAPAGAPRWLLWAGAALTLLTSLALVGFFLYLLGILGNIGA